jgi:hypothetical protein
MNKGVLTLKWYPLPLRGSEIKTLERNSVLENSCANPERQHEVLKTLRLHKAFLR